MPFALNIAIAVRIGERFGRHAENPMIENVQDIQAGEASPRMACAGIEDDLQQAPAEAD